MEIKRIAGYPTVQINRLNDGAERTGGDEKRTSAKDLGVASDRVDFSKGYQEMVQARKVMMDRSDVRTDVVEQYRNEIKTNTYTVDAEKIAESMLGGVW